MAYYECIHERPTPTVHVAAGLCDIRSATPRYGDCRGPASSTTGGRTPQDPGRDPSGSFAREWLLENIAGRPGFLALRRLEAEHPCEKVGEELRDLMPWLKKPVKPGAAAAKKAVAAKAAPKQVARKTRMPKSTARRTKR
jgi:ketol-acid reductoisomerase